MKTSTWDSNLIWLFFFDLCTFFFLWKNTHYSRFMRKIFRTSMISEKNPIFVCQIWRAIMHFEFCFCDSINWAFWFNKSVSDFKIFFLKRIACFMNEHLQMKWDAIGWYSPFIKQKRREWLFSFTEWETHRDNFADVSDWLQLFTVRHSHMLHAQWTRFMDVYIVHCTTVQTSRNPWCKHELSGTAMEGKTTAIYVHRRSGSIVLSIISQANSISKATEKSVNTLRIFIVFRFLHMQRVRKNEGEWANAMSRQSI